MAYKIHVTKAIWASDEQTNLFDDLYCDIELPFVPFIGLAITQLGGWSCNPLESLTWNAEKQMFFAETLAEVGNDSRSAEDIRNWDLKYSGWLSHKVKVPS